MEIVHALELVRAHRQRIDEHIDRAVARLALHPAAARRPLATARWQLLQMLRHYHLFKRVELFEPALRWGTPDHVRRARDLLTTCHAGWEAFGAYTLDWSSRDIVAEWPEYTRAMQAMADRIHRHVADEELQIERLLAGARQIRHPGFAPRADRAAGFDACQAPAPA